MWKSGLAQNENVAVVRFRMQAMWPMATFILLNIQYLEQYPVIAPRCVLPAAR